MKKILVAILCGLQLLLAVPAFAHHSASQFDFKAPISLTGVVKEVTFANPHLRLLLEVPSKGGRVIEFEGHSVNNLYRAGWRKDMVKVGDTITVTLAPRKDGADGGFVQSVKLADGRSF